jgi:hypothetical protein
LNGRTDCCRNNKFSLFAFARRESRRRHGATIVASTRPPRIRRRAFGTVQTIGRLRIVGLLLADALRRSRSRRARHHGAEQRDVNVATGKRLSLYERPKCKSIRSTICVGKAAVIPPRLESRCSAAQYSFGGSAHHPRRRVIGRAGCVRRATRVAAPQLRIPKRYPRWRDCPPRTNL